MRGEKADFIPEVYSTMKDVVFPGDRFIELGPNFDPYGTGPDAWGVLWTNQGPNPVVDGNTVAANFRLFEDLEDSTAEELAFAVCLNLEEEEGEI